MTAIAHADDDAKSLKWLWLPIAAASLILFRIELLPALALAAATLISEDLTCLAAGDLLRRGQIHWLTAIGGCTLGIYLGDLGLWLLGRTLGHRVLKLPWLVSRIGPDSLQRLARWFDDRSAAAIFAARFLPGTRLPLYVAAGTLGRKSASFATWTFLAALTWTPLIVLLAAALGEAFIAPFRAWIGSGWLSLAFMLVIALPLLRLARLLSTKFGRYRLIASLSRIWRWEFWPIWLFYLPLIPWIIGLSIRYRGFTTITAANPSIPSGGFVGESKFQILRALHASEFVIETELLEPDHLDRRIARLRNRTFPLILKPDVGQRGTGVRCVRCIQEAAAYLEHHPEPLLVQPFDSGPYEAGIFYYRFPSKPHGRIFSITDKTFPDLVGDGASTIEELIWCHPRYRMQAKVFLKRHAQHLDRVLPAGKRFPLTMAGNHCQGTIFCDGAALITPALERRIDEIARSFEGGFHFGRFDLRFNDVDRFKSGEAFTIIELNGVTSESTNIYDPASSLLSAYRTLVHQWLILFRIGHENRRRGHPRTSARDLSLAVSAHLRTRVANDI
jgi:membrane protein DedA with SNARE-associated domain